jgi:hypothetical protein
VIGLTTSFNIWAFTAAAKALVIKREEQKMTHDRLIKRAEHHTHLSHFMDRRVNDEPVRAVPPKSYQSSDSMPARLDVNIGMFTAPDSTTTPTEYAKTPKSTSPSSAIPSTSPSQIDLTKPIITPSAADAANDEEIDTEDMESEYSSSSEESDVESANDAVPPPVVSVTGTEPVPPPHSFMVSERVSIRGRIRPFEPVAQVAALDPALRDHIGQVHPDGAIQKWIARRAEWDSKYSSALDKWREVRRADRVQAEQAGFLTRELKGERPPLASLAGWYDVDRAREVGASVDEIGKKTSKGVMMWMNLSSKVSYKAFSRGNQADVYRRIRSSRVETPWARSRRTSRRSCRTGTSRRWLCRAQTANRRG